MKLFKKRIYGHIYGPPEMLEKRKRQNLFFAKNNSPECIYGPPEMLEARRNDKPRPAPKDNIAVDIYGPPEMLEINKDISETNVDIPDDIDKNYEENDDK